MATQIEKMKWVEGTPFMVDGFRFTNPRCKHYLLTHFHSDHTTGLTRSFSAGIIYTSEGTAALITELMGVNPERVVALPMERPVMVAGFEITLLDANHCPAAVMFLIRDLQPGGRTSLHTGDFRAAPAVCRNPLLASMRGRIDTLYLDTTYCGTKHTFPDQEEVLEWTRQVVRHELARDPRTLFLVGTYQIGKERVLEAVARAAGSRCLVSAHKARVLRLSGAWRDSVYTTHDAGEGGLEGQGHCCVRAVPLMETRPDALLSTLADAQAKGCQFTSVCGVRPTGWTHTNRRGVGAGAGAGAGAGGRGGKEGKIMEDDPRTGKTSCGEGAATITVDSEGEEYSGGREGEGLIPGDLKGGGGEEGARALAATSAGAGVRAGGKVVGWSGKKPWVNGAARLYSVPYSEHSSFPQLQDFVKAVRPRAIVPTVNGSSPASVERMLSHFLHSMDLSSDKKRLDSYFSKPSSAPPLHPQPQPTLPSWPRASRECMGAATGPTGGGSGRVSSPSPSSEAMVVPLNMVDVEAQRAILADIERRKRVPADREGGGHRHRVGGRENVRPRLGAATGFREGLGLEEGGLSGVGGELPPQRRRRLREQEQCQPVGGRGGGAAQVKKGRPSSFLGDVSSARRGKVQAGELGWERGEKGVGGAGKSQGGTGCTTAPTSSPITMRDFFSRAR